MAYLSDLILKPSMASFGYASGPQYMTKVNRSPNGAEYRDKLRAYKLARYTVRYDNSITWAQMLAFFDAAGGMAHTWRLIDPLDNAATVSEGSFIATAVATEWQMVKKVLVSGSTYAYRLVTKPFSTATAAAGVVDYTTGIVTNATVPASWSGSFYAHVRFDVDDLVPSVVNKSGGTYVTQFDDIPIVEVPV
jgi:uncharacterized protein (TIGR02217 family)